MQPVRHLAAYASIGVLTLLAALPWGLPPQERFFLPMLPVVAIHFWSLRYPALVPEWAVFFTGLGLDVLTHGPLGYWPLVYMTTHALGVLSAPYADRGLAARLVLFIAALLSVAVVSWAVASVYFLERAEAWPYAVGAGLAALAASVLMPLLALTDPVSDARDNVRLERGV